MSGIDFPETNFAYTAFTSLAHRHGLKQRSINLARERMKADLPAEIVRLKIWWVSHGQDFLAEKPVPNPNLTGFQHFMSRGRAIELFDTVLIAH